jgi:hypothetical protein
MTRTALEDGEVALPLGRPATAHEIAIAIAGVVDVGSTYLNGAVIPVDGGVTSAWGTVRLTPRVEARAS